MQNSPTRSFSDLAKSRQFSLQRTAYLVHSFVGLKLSLLFAVVVFSGALAVLSQEVDWLLYSQMRVDAQEQRLDEGVLFDKLQAAYSEHGLSFLQTMAEQPNFASFAMYNDAQGGFRYAWIDPYTGEVKGDTPVLTVGRFIGFLHSTLYLPVIGRGLVNVFGLLTAISLIAGLCAYPKFWRYFFKVPRVGNLRVFWADTHKLIGLWSLWFVLIIALTGSWWFYKNPLVRDFNAPNIVKPFPEKPLLDKQALDQFTVQPNANKQDLAARMSAVLKRSYPEAVVLSIVPPEHNAEPFEFIIADNAWLVPQSRQNKIYINPLNSQIIGTSLVKNFSTSQRVDSAMIPLHLGNWAQGSSADLWVKLLWFIFGLALTALCVSGLIIHLKRTAKRVKKISAQGHFYYWVKCWRIIKPWGRPFGVYKYLNILLLLAMGAGCAIALTLSSQGTKGAGVIYPTKKVGDWDITMNAVAGLLEKDIYPIRPGKMVTFNVELSASALSSIKFAYLSIGKPQDMKNAGHLVEGPLGATHSRFRLADTINADEVWLSIQRWDGQWQQASWPLNPENK